jgi:anti-sigma28 factor (negative regulator of flagellin synthesis)
MSSGGKESGKKGHAAKTARNGVSLEARHKTKMMAKGTGKLREQKIRKITEQIEQGTYQVDAADVAKAIVCSKVARLLGGKRR